MNIIKRIFKRPTETRNANNLSVIFVNNGNGGGIGNDATSWAAVDMIASSMANLSGAFFDRDTRQALKEHPLYDLLQNPNGDETRFQFMHSSVKDYFVNGNVYWYKYDNGAGDTTALFRLDPNKVTIRRDSWNQKVFIHEGREYRGDKILHVPSRHGFDGTKGRSIFSECGNVFRLSGELDEFVNNSFNNSVGNRLVIDINKNNKDATDEQLDQLKSQFLQNYTGIRNAGKPLIKSQGIEYSSIETKTPTNQASQLLENRQHQEREMAKLFGIPLALLNGAETGNIESVYILYIESAIRPLATQFEQAIYKLIPARERGRLYYEYSYNSLMKTSMNDRIANYARQMQIGILSIDEIRAKENLPPIEAGSTHWIPSNMMPVKREVVDSYMAGAKLKQAEYERQINAHSPGVVGNHSNLGDDKA